MRKPKGNTIVTGNTVIDALFESIQRWTPCKMQK